MVCFLNFITVRPHLLLCLLALKGGRASHGEGDSGGRYYTVVAAASLAPVTACQPSSDVPKAGASLTVIPSNGPCSPKPSAMPDLAHAVAVDLLRLHSIHSSLASVNSKAATVPVKSLTSIGSPNYVVNLLLGTPPQNLTFSFDTAVELSWSPCQPCQSCHKQLRPIFNRTASSTYHDVSCNSTFCTGLNNSYGTGCSGSSCGYTLADADGYTSGIIGSDTLIMGSDTVQTFRFGCGDDNEGSFNNTSGTLGLGYGGSGLVSQTAGKYNLSFSYCLPTASAQGYLRIGRTDRSFANTPYAKLVAFNWTSQYFVKLSEIHVANETLRIDASDFVSWLVLDSGTKITRLPPAAYDFLSSAFRRGMKNYRQVKSTTGLLDPCFDLSDNTSSIRFPTVTLVFDGNAAMKMTAQGTLTGDSLKEKCLAFAPTNDVYPGTLGSLQQATHDITLDVGGGRLWFAGGGCT